MRAGVAAACACSIAHAPLAVKTPGCGAPQAACHEASKSCGRGTTSCPNSPHTSQVDRSSRRFGLRRSRLAGAPATRRITTYGAGRWVGEVRLRRVRLRGFRLGRRTIKPETVPAGDGVHEVSSYVPHSGLLAEAASAGSSSRGAQRYAPHASPAAAPVMAERSGRMTTAGWRPHNGRGRLGGPVRRDTLNQQCLSSGETV